MLQEDLINQLVGKMIEKLNPSFILLFGSQAKGVAHEKSDIDLAYFSDIELSSYERFLFASELAELAGCEVDLVDSKQVDTIFTMQIFEQGIPIYIQDQDELTRQTMRAYSMYAEFSERRAPFVNAIFERGSVYGDE